MHWGQGLRSIWAWFLSFISSWSYRYPRYSQIKWAQDLGATTLRRGTTWMVMKSPSFILLFGEPKLIVGLYLGLVSRCWHYMTLQAWDSKSDSRLGLSAFQTQGGLICFNHHFPKGICLGSTPVAWRSQRCYEHFRLPCQIQEGRAHFTFFSRSAHCLKIGNWGNVQMFWCCGSRHIGNSIWGDNLWANSWRLLMEFVRENLSETGKYQLDGYWYFRSFELPEYHLDGWVIHG